MEDSSEVGQSGDNAREERHGELDQQSNAFHGGNVNLRHQDSVSGQ